MNALPSRPVPLGWPLHLPPFIREPHSLSLAQDVRYSPLKLCAITDVGLMGVDEGEILSGHNQAVEDPGPYKPLTS